MAILERLPTRCTHLAVNEGIPLHVKPQGVETGNGHSTKEAVGTTAVSENILRSPTGLRPLYGDFGPELVDVGRICDQDFGKAFWVSTKQNGIFQTWSPRWTMFSRGNIKEKARLLRFHDASSIDVPAVFPHRVRSPADMRDKWAVDLYAGIGYFVFSYAKLGFRVLCWELNPWSVEGLRRGALRNGWSVLVVKGESLKLPTPALMAGQERILVLLENNREAERRIRELRETGIALDVSHVNCGFLPASEPTWKSAWDMVAKDGEGWLHLHENVGVKDIGRRRQEIQALLDGWSDQARRERSANVEHVEQVKTFAPDVWHCVFDVYVTACRV
jgi:tRNA wybutosine-synthesizing protein 2